MSWPFLGTRSKYRKQKQGGGSGKILKRRRVWFEIQGKKQ